MPVELTIEALFDRKAAAVQSPLIESVTIYPGEAGGAEAEVVAKVSNLMAFATNDNAAPEGRRIAF